MPGLDGTGPVGLGPMTGGGRGFCSPWGIGAWARLYGVPWWGYRYLPRRWFAPWAVPFAAPLSREQELSYLKERAKAVKAELNEIEARIKELSKETK